MLTWLRGRLARAVCPDVHQDAQRYARLVCRLDEARWWMGASHPEAASLAQMLLDQDHWYWTSRSPLRDPSWKWQAPEYVIDVPSFRNWLDTRPFER